MVLFFGTKIIYLLIELLILLQVALKFID